MKLKNEDICFAKIKEEAEKSFEGWEFTPVMQEEVFKRSESRKEKIVGYKSIWSILRPGWKQVVAAVFIFLIVLVAAPASALQDILTRFFRLTQEFFQQDEGIFPAGTWVTLEGSYRSGQALRKEGEVYLLLASSSPRFPIEAWSIKEDEIKIANRTYFSSAPRCIYVGDVTGDGKDEVIAITGDQINLFVWNQEETLLKGESLGEIRDIQIITILGEAKPLLVVAGQDPGRDKGYLEAWQYTDHGFQVWGFFELPARVSSVTSGNFRSQGMELILSLEGGEVFMVTLSFGGVIQAQPLPLKEFGLQSNESLYVSSFNISGKEVVVLLMEDTVKVLEFKSSQFYEVYNDTPLEGTKLKPLLNDVVLGQNEGKSLLLETGVIGKYVWVSANMQTLETGTLTLPGQVFTAVDLDNDGVDELVVGTESGVIKIGKVLKENSY